MLQHIYTDTETLNYNNVLKVIYCGKKYQVDSLVEACYSFMESELKVDNACSILESSPFLMDNWHYALEFIEKNASEVLESEGFNEVSSDLLCRIIKSDSLCLPELDILEACMKWARKECARRVPVLNPTPANLRMLLLPVLKHIRFTNMTADEIAVDVSPLGILTPQEMLQIYVQIGSKAETDQDIIDFDSTVLSKIQKSAAYDKDDENDHDLGESKQQHQDEKRPQQDVVATL